MKRIARRRHNLLGYLALKYLGINPYSYRDGHIVDDSGWPAVDAPDGGFAERVHPGGMKPPACGPKDDPLRPDF